MRFILLFVSRHFRGIFVRLKLGACVVFVIELVMFASPLPRHRSGIINTFNITLRQRADERDRQYRM